MSKYRIFRRTWWADTACTRPALGRKYYSGQVAGSEAQARLICRANNLEDFGSETGRGPRGAAWEFEAS